MKNINLFYFMFCIFFQTPLKLKQDIWIVCMLQFLHSVQYIKEIIILGVLCPFLLAWKYYICFHLIRSMNDWLWRAISHYTVDSFSSHSLFLLRFKPLVVWTCINYTLPELNNFDEFSNSVEKKNKKNKSLKW